MAINVTKYNLKFTMKKK